MFVTSLISTNHRKYAGVHSLLGAFFIQLVFCDFILNNLDNTFKVCSQVIEAIQLQLFIVSGRHFR